MDDDAETPKKRRMGRPEYFVSDSSREEVKRLKAASWTDERIARRMHIATSTLVKHYKDELRYGADEKRAELIMWAERAASKGNAGMMKWLAALYMAEAAARNAAIAKAIKEAQDADDAPPLAKAPKLGKREERQQAAEQVTGKFAPPPPPTKQLN